VSWLRAIDLGSPSLLTSKPVKCYNRKMRDNKFLNVDDSLIAKTMSAFGAPPLFWCNDRLGLVPKVAD
jgi:hypothetical protein